MVNFIFVFFIGKLFKGLLRFRVYIFKYRLCGWVFVLGSKGNEFLKMVIYILFDFFRFWLWEGR